MLYEIEFPLDALSPQAVEAALFELGAASITFQDGGDEPVLEPKPGEVRLWSQTQVRALFDGSLDALGTVGLLAERLGAHITAHARIHGVEERDWERVWLENWSSMRFGRRLWVCPTSAAEPADPAALVVRLDPGLAFGTGTHPTTALCLQLLDALELGGRSVIDYGCGSGILGIAALKLGAARVWAVDIDPQALTATRTNGARNGVSARLEVHAPPVHLPPSDLVLANILAQPLVELAPLLTSACRPGGDLVLSGLLKSQAHQVRAAYGAAFDIVRTVHREDWCCIHGRRVQTPRTGS
ncbi:MAG TPA: 50S ribosomal protein L11 methyltransferase [Steroidobacteraceae bacterium]|nr:50S ribosomal protein L11 methyltransferase [Steroidobacteraceae bacterium]